MPRTPGQMHNRNRLHLAPPLQVLARQDPASYKGFRNDVHFRQRATCKPKGMPLPPRHRHRLPTRFLKAFPLGARGCAEKNVWKLFKMASSSIHWREVSSSYISNKSLPLKNVALFPGAHTSN